MLLVLVVYQPAERAARPPQRQMWGNSCNKPAENNEAAVFMQEGRDQVTPGHEAA